MPTSIDYVHPSFEYSVKWNRFVFDVKSCLVVKKTIHVLYNSSLPAVVKLKNLSGSS